MREKKRGFLSSFFSFVLMASAGLVILALFYLIDQNTQKLADIEQRLGDMGAETRDVLNESRRLQGQVERISETAAGDWDDIRDQLCPLDVVSKASASVYFLTIRDPDGTSSSQATAFVVDQENGILATNAHVAQFFKKQSPSGEPFEIYVTGPSGTTNHLVKDVKLHAGFDAYRTDLESYDPFISGHSGKISFVAGGAGFDVALLYVDQSEKLAPALPIASADALSTLKENASLVLIGYPSTTFSAFNLVRPTPRVQQGRITAIDHYLQVGATRENAFSIRHNAPSGQGASGSPLVNCAGQVVAVHSMNEYSIASEFGAQRADLLSELLRGEDREILTARHQPTWRKLLDEFGQGHNDIPSVLALRKGRLVADFDHVFGPSTPASLQALRVCLENPMRPMGRAMRQSASDAMAASTTVKRGEVKTVQGGRSQCEQPLKIEGDWIAGQIDLPDPGRYIMYAYGYFHYGGCNAEEIGIRKSGTGAIDWKSYDYFGDVTYLTLDTTRLQERTFDVFVRYGGRSECEPRSFDFGVAKLKERGSNDVVSELRLRDRLVSTFRAVTSSAREFFFNE